MAESKQSSSSVTSSLSGPSSSLVTPHNQAETSLLVTNHRLNGHNYLQWSQSVMMFISGKGRDDYLTRETNPLEKTDPQYKIWKSENNMVISWLINSMTTEIGENFLL